MQTTRVVDVQGTVIKLRGPLDFSSRGALRTAIDDGLAQGQRDFILDLQDVCFIDSSGLGALVACFSSVRRHGGSLKLQRVPARVYELIDMTRLTHFFEVCGTPSTAPPS